MHPTFRQSMAWLHTWFGLALGFVLMVCFYFGSLSVFDREIDRWALPDTRFDPQPMPSFDRVLLPAFTRILPDEKDFATNAPLLIDTSKAPLPERASLQPEELWAYTTHRDPVLMMGVGFGVPHPKDPAAHNHIHGNATIDPRTGQSLPASSLKIGSEFFYPMHYGLHLEWKNIGIFIVGLAGMVMLAALVSGVVIHRRLIRELFTFRPKKHIQRSTLDLHNLTGVAALPFHFFFAFTGLVVFAPFYFLPVADTVLRPAHLAYEEREAAAKGLPHEASGVPGALASVDAMVVEAKRRWEARGMPGEVGYLEVHHVGDANAVVSLYRAGSDQVALVGQGVHFRGTTGEVLYEEPSPSVVGAINEFLTGLHLQHFEHWPLRWLYVMGGLLGCVCIATGFIFFVEKRKDQHARLGLQGARWVDGLATACVTGMVAASLAILVANRLLPQDMPQRDLWEKLAFWLTWLSSAVHGVWRAAPVAKAGRSPAWAEQCRAIAVLAILAAALNALTTGDHLGQTLFRYWPVAGVDLALLCAGVLAWTAARRLTRNDSTRAGSPSRRALNEEARHV